MPALVVPAEATINTGTQPARQIGGDGGGERRGRHAAGAVGRDQPRRGAPDSRLVRDLHPAAMAFLARCRTPGARKSARAVGGELRMGAGQRAQEPRVIGLRSAGGKVPAATAARNPARCATMRITCASSATAAGEVAELATCGLNEPDDAVGALRRETRGWD